MACRLVGAKPLSEPVLKYCKLDHQEKKLQWNINQNSYISIEENEIENVVCDMFAIFSASIV